MTNDQSPMTKFRRFAWWPIPLLLAAVVVLWIANPQVCYESRAVVFLMNVFFVGLVSLCIAYLAGRGFLTDGQPGLLMFGCGALLWGVAVVVSSALVNRGANVAITIHNAGMLGSALCYLGGLARHARVRRPAVRLAGGYAGALAAVALLTWAALMELTPAFFVQGHGGTPLRQAVLIATIAIYAGTAGLMLRRHHRQPSTFLYWYGLGLTLLAVGLAGFTLQAVHGGLLGWMGRVAQGIGGGYLFVAALTAVRETGARRLSLTAINRAWHEDLLPALQCHSMTWWAARYSLAVAAVALGFGFRVAMETWGGHALPPYVAFFPAIMVTALLGGPGPGLFATTLSCLAADIWVLNAGGMMGLASPAERVGLTIFFFSGGFMSLIAGIHQRIRSKAAAYDREAALRESRERLAAFAQATFEGIGESENGRVVDCNEQLARICGCTVAELKGTAIADFIAPEDRERVLAGIRRNEESVIEHAMIRKDGTRIVVETHGRPAEPGGTRRYTAVRDITGRKQTEEALRASLREKEVLLKEVHHRVKNNLQVISSLVSLQAAALKESLVSGQRSLGVESVVSGQRSLDKPSGQVTNDQCPMTNDHVRRLRAVFDDLRDQVRAMALVHEKLYRSEDFGRVEFDGYARSLLEGLWRTYGTAAANVRLRLDLQPAVLSIETAVPCGLILNELATNALKHAFRGRADGEVAVSVQGGPGNRMRIHVADNGVGLPDGLDWRNAQSLGLRLVQMLAGQVGGTVEARSGGSAEGTEFEVVIGE